MMSRRNLRTSLAVLLCLVAIPVFVGCGNKTTAPVVTATGACCVGTSCMTLSAATCSQNGGTYKGDNLSCATSPCAPPATTGTITGTASLPLGVPGDISNTMIQIYQNYADWNEYRPLATVGGVTQGGVASLTFTFTNVTPGTYYLDCWKDNDLSGRWSNGDFLGVYGTTVWPGMTLAPFQVAAGQTKNVAVTVIAINWY